MSHPDAETLFSRILLSAMALVFFSCNLLGQELQQFIDDGEYSAAIQTAGNDTSALAQIASAQLDNGEQSAALQTLGHIRNDAERGKALKLAFAQQLSDDRGNFGGSATGTVQNGGGITANDFNTLIQLVQNTIASDTWEANGGGNGTMFPYPNGVFVDAEGVLNRIPKTKKALGFEPDFEDAILAHRSVQTPSRMRKVSLTRLERAIQLLSAQGRKPTDVMNHLAGLTDIRYVMIDPDSGEVIVAGPAGGWKQDGNGKIISKVSKQPVLLLDDLVVCLRNAFRDSNGGKFGCAIVPRKENLAATKKYVGSARGSGRRWEKGLREALGQQDIDVFGIPAESHAAKILVEADYHMKLVGMGIEPSIPSVPSYLERVELDANGNPPPMDVVRWWFAVNYDQLISNEERTLFEFAGPGVKVLAETEFVNDSGERIHTGKAVGPTRTFARDFTRHFSSLAKAYPIYNELKNVFDLAIVANLIRQHELAKKANWKMSCFFDDDFQLSTFRAARTVDSVLNRRVIKDRRNGETTIHTLIGVSGGVSFDATEFVSEANVEVERDVEFTGQLEKATDSLPDIERWWWD